MANKRTHSATIGCALWLRSRWWAFALCSVVLLVPCFWHHHVQACDLGSHLYNAWLSQIVARGVLPGLHLESRYTNVLVDSLLSTSFPYLGAVGTERAVTSICVLVFFWGSFALVSAATGRAAWRVAPLLAMISYGAIFHWGFLNFYLSAGFSFFALALIVCGTAADLAWLPLLLALSASAHPLGAACLLALGLYLALLRLSSPKVQAFTTVIFLGLAYLVRWIVVHKFEVLPRDVSYYYLVGADQLVVFGRSFLVLAVLLLGLCAVCVSLQAKEIWKSPWLHAYLVVALVVATAPGGLFSSEHFGMMGFLPDRASLYSAVLLAVLVACCRPRPWFVVSSSIICGVFFVLLYRDTGVLERRTDHLEELVQRGRTTRIVSFVPAVPGWRIHEDHSLERACVGRCYVYNNYEPSTNQFRLQADEGNHVVKVDEQALEDMSDGSYIVQPVDLPLLEAYQCGNAAYDVCIVALQAGQHNGDVPDVRPAR